MWATTGTTAWGAFQGGTRQLLNAVDIGAAYLAKNQDPTLGTSTTPGATAYTTNLLRPFRGFSGIEQNTPEFWDTYHSMQMNVNRRFGGGFSFGANYTYGISLKGNTGLNQTAHSTRPTGRSRSGLISRRTRS